MIPYRLGVTYTGTEKDYVQSFKQLQVKDVQSAVVDSLK